jgi:hypothetical protein
MRDLLSYKGTLTEPGDFGWAFVFTRAPGAISGGKFDGRIND